MTLCKLLKEESSDEEKVVLMIWGSKVDLCPSERERAVSPDAATRLAQALIT